MSEYMNSSYIAKEKCHNLNNSTSCVNIVSQSMNTKQPLRKHWNIQTFNNKLQTIPPIIYESNIYIYMHIYIKMYKKICYNINIIFYFRVIIGEPLTLDQPDPLSFL
jgi:hypothetical protein